MKTWITGGGTREPIDAVRYIGNRSTGNLALALTRAALEREHDVTLFVAASVEVPAPVAEACRVRRFETSADLLERLGSEPDAPDAIVHAAAISDYAPVAVPGKVASGKAEWSIMLRPLPKVADQLRSRFPSAVLLIFKLETGVPVEELWKRARAAASRAGAELVFANLLEEVGPAHRGWLLAEDRCKEIEGREAIALEIVAAMEERVRCVLSRSQGGGADG